LPLAASPGFFILSLASGQRITYNILTQPDRSGKMKNFDEVPVKRNEIHKALTRRGYVVSNSPTSHIYPMAQRQTVWATKDGKTITVLVRTGDDKFSFRRNVDGSWKGLNEADIVLVAFGSTTMGIEIVAYDAAVIADSLDRNFKARLDAGHSSVFDSLWVHRYKKDENHPWNVGSGPQYLWKTWSKKYRPTNEPEIQVAKEVNPTIEATPIREKENPIIIDNEVHSFVLSRDNMKPMIAQLFNTTEDKIEIIVRI
jgi:hypothetical protein